MSLKLSRCPAPQVHDAALLALLAPQIYVVTCCPASILSTCNSPDRVATLRRVCSGPRYCRRWQGCGTWIWPMHHWLPWTLRPVDLPCGEMTARAPCKKPCCACVQHCLYVRGPVCPLPGASMRDMTCSASEESACWLTPACGMSETVGSGTGVSRCLTDMDTHVLPPHRQPRAP